MSFFDLINELRTKEASPEKAARAMKILALICIIGGIWNYAFAFIAPVNRMPVAIHPDFPGTALVTGIILACLFFLAGRGIADREGWGKRVGQLAIVLLVTTIIIACYSIFSGFNSAVPMPPAPILITFSVLFIAQFVVPAYFGIQYLGRLPVDENSYMRPAIRLGQAMRAPAGSSEPGQSMPVKSYKEAPVPFGVAGTFVISLAIPMIFLVTAEKYASPPVFALLFGAMFLVLFAGPVLYNRKPSSFEQARTVLASYTGGGSLMLFNGSWPFFRLLVYDDGVEIRVEYHRFFIPYDKMEDLPDKIKFFSLGGILFKSDLPGVPSSIRFHGRNSKKILEFVNERRGRFLEIH